MTCNDCIHSGVCAIQLEPHYILDRAQKLMRESNNVEHECLSFKDRSRFVELIIAKKIKHSPDIEKMREFHKLGLGKGMSERSIFWTCSNCEMWTSLAHKFCPNCGAKFETEQALKEREDNV